MNKLQTWNNQINTLKSNIGREFKNPWCLHWNFIKTKYHNRTNMHQPCFEINFLGRQDSVLYNLWLLANIELSDAQYADFRPISITPVLTRLVEKTVVSTPHRPLSSFSQTASVSLLPGSICIPANWLNHSNHHIYLPHYHLFPHH